MIRRPQSQARAQAQAAWPVVRLRGEIDLSNADALFERVERAVPNTARGLVLDLSGVTFLDSTGLRVVFGLARRLGDRQQALRLVVPPGARIARVLEFAGVNSVAQVMRAYDADTDDADTDDAGTDDAGTDDAGTDDAGTDDAGTDDAGTDDAGTDDAGTDDAGTDDAGTGGTGSDGAGERS